MSLSSKTLSNTRPNNSNTPDSFLRTSVCSDTKLMSRPEPTPWAGLALENHCWPQANPWPDLLSGRLKHKKQSQDITHENN